MATPRNSVKCWCGKTNTATTVHDQPIKSKRIVLCDQLKARRFIYLRRGEHTDTRTAMNEDQIEPFIRSIRWDVLPARWARKKLKDLFRNDLGIKLPRDGFLERVRGPVGPDSSTAKYTWAPKTKAWLVEHGGLDALLEDIQLNNAGYTSAASSDAGESTERERSMEEDRRENEKTGSGASVAASVATDRARDDDISQQQQQDSGASETLSAYLENNPPQEAYLERQRQQEMKTKETEGGKRQQELLLQLLHEERRRQEKHEQEEKERQQKKHRQAPPRPTGKKAVNDFDHLHNSFETPYGNTTTTTTTTMDPPPSVIAQPSFKQPSRRLTPSRCEYGLPVAPVSPTTDPSKRNSGEGGWGPSSPYTPSRPKVKKTTPPRATPPRAIPPRAATTTTTTTKATAAAPQKPPAEIGWRPSPIAATRLVRGYCHDPTQRAELSKQERVLIDEIYKLEGKVWALHKRLCDVREQKFALYKMSEEEEEEEEEGED
ncbi:hypothetical protein MKZ38_006182 [Zalerion maritima]|uniref:Uncharacterized protein n=1 Tax=Zalerion maritima TaxID=339359 RepID=A0AAD5WNK6_9PEZI|nr:hypothetical protein MKZ38_006182 [Zalerion maritima]